METAGPIYKFWIEVVDGEPGTEESIAKCPDNYVLFDCMCYTLNG